MLLLDIAIHRLLLLLLLRYPPARLPAVQRTTPKDQRGPNYHLSTQLMTKQDRAEYERNQLSDVQNDRDCDCRGFRRQQINARDACELGDGVEKQKEKTLRELAEQWSHQVVQPG